MASLIGWGYSVVENVWKNGKTFTLRNPYFVELAFTFVFALLQVILVVTTFISKNIDNVKIIISLFSITLLTLFAIQKLFLTIRIEYVEKTVQQTMQEQYLKNMQSMGKIKASNDELQEIVSSLAQHLKK